jgi:hypothetical protein
MTHRPKRHGIAALLGLFASASIAGCETQPLETPAPDVIGLDHNVFQQSVNRKLDLVFMIDDSPSMSPLQVQMAKNLPDFMNVLKNPDTGGLPDLHIGVISQDLGAGRSSFNGCQRVGGDQGQFFNAGVNPVGCTGPSDKYIIDTINPDGTRTTNFDPSLDVTNVFSCISLLGDRGCGLEAQLGSILAALAPTPPPGNEGFLRDDAYLAVVMLTNEDDCTIPPDGDLGNPNMTDPTRDMYGALQSYRCTEFGIDCDQPLPHLAPATPVTLTNCHSKEGPWLLKVSDFIAQMKATKADPSKILMAAIAAPTVDGQGQILPISVSSTMIGTVAAPVLDHECDAYAADSAIRIFEAVSAFNGVWESICQDNYAQAMTEIAKTINKHLGPQCVDGKIASAADGSPHCNVVDRKFGSNGSSYTDTPLPYCGSAPGTVPCWSFQASANCPNGQQLVVQRDPTIPIPSVSTVADCEICVPESSSPSCQ